VKFSWVFFCIKIPAFTFLQQSRHPVGYQRGSQVSQIEIKEAKMQYRGWKSRQVGQEVSNSSEENKFVWK
jgi:hypothetical protein